MARTFQSIPYFQSITQEMMPEYREVDPFFSYSTHESHQPLKEDTTSAWSFLDQLFPDDHTVAVIDGLTFDTPARLECFWDDNLRKRGITIFDQQGRLIIHVHSALLGYEGSGPRLSWQLMERLGVPRKLFDELQVEANLSRPYMMIVSREQYEHRDGTHYIAIGTPVQDAWTRWRVE